ncbi:MAG: CPBP family intramembrane metalloprotease [Acidobacteria bacterium]|nr:CPBP family intramembrane metalloprotease [Acidobacteriota bacterium]
MPQGPSAAEPGILESLRPGAVVLRVFLFVILLVGFSATMETLAAMAGLVTRSNLYTSGLFYSEASKAIGALLAAWVMSRLEGRRLGEYGLPWGAGQGKLFFQGAAFGLVEICGIVGVLGGTGYYSFGSLEVHGADLVKWAIFWVVLFVIVGFFEEYAFRGYAQFALTKGFGFWPATIVTSLIFGAVHIANPGENWPGIAGVVVVGIFWCFTLRRTGSLWFAFGMHAAFDFGETFLFSVPDSGVILPGHLSSAVIHDGPAWLVGGTAGPEASVLDFMILAIFFYVVHRMYPAKPELVASGAPIGPVPTGESAVSIEAPSAPAGGENQRTSSEA